MTEITFSLMGTDVEVQSIKPWMEEFERRFHVRVKIQALEWVGGWEQIVKIALGGQGADISEIGTTWSTSLAAMNALRPFTGLDIQLLGGKDTFLTSSWNSCTEAGDSQIWAVPWLTDVHLLFYRRDVLEQAHIAPEFASAAETISTLKALQQAGHPTPLSLTINAEPNLMHDAASWVWSEGGGFLADDGSKVTFDQPKALRGFINYFNLRQFLPAGYQNNQNAWNKFVAGERLIAFGTPAHYLQAQISHPETAEKWGVSSIIDSSFVGGTNLVIWKHSRQSSAALDLIRFLSEKTSGYPATPHSFHTPCRVSALNQLEQEENHVTRAIVQAIKTGHSYKTNRLWGLLEKNLVNQLGNIWQTLLDDPTIEVESATTDSLTPLARRLNIALSG